MDNEISFLRQTSKCVQAITLLRPVWITACISHQLFNDTLTSGLNLNALSTAELEQRAYRAEYLRSFWQSSDFKPSDTPHVCRILTPSSTSIKFVRFLPGNGVKYRIVAILSGIWSTLIIWELDDTHSAGGRLLCEWTPRGAVIDSIVVNPDINSKICLAVGLRYESGVDRIDLFSMTCDTELSVIKSIETPFTPVMLHGNLLAYSDLHSKTVIHNWSTDTTTMFDSSVAGDERFTNRCSQILLMHQSVLVVRERSLDFFLFTADSTSDTDTTDRAIRPIASYSLGWLEGVYASASPVSEGEAYPPIFILSRPEGNDPWAKDTHKTELHSFQPDSAYNIGLSSCPYLPLSERAVQYQYTTTSGPLLCPHVRLGSYGTALWIQTDRHKQKLVGALYSEEKESVSKVLFTDMANWTCFDYYESGGMLVFGSTSGVLTTVRL